MNLDPEERGFLASLRRLAAGATTTTTSAAATVAVATTELDRLTALGRDLSGADRERAHELAHALDSHEVRAALHVPEPVPPEIQAAAMTRAKYLKKTYAAALANATVESIAAHLAQGAVAAAAGIGSGGNEVLAAATPAAARRGADKSGANVDHQGLAAVAMAVSNANRRARDPFGFAVAEVRTAVLREGRFGDRDPELKPLLSRASAASTRAQTSVEAMRRARAQLHEAVDEAVTAAATLGAAAERRAAELPALELAVTESYDVAQAAHSAAQGDFRLVAEAHDKIAVYAAALVRHELAVKDVTRLRDRARLADEHAQAARAASKEALAQSIAAVRADDERKAREAAARSTPRSRADEPTRFPVEADEAEVDEVA